MSNLPPGVTDAMIEDAQFHGSADATVGRPRYGRCEINILSFEAEDWVNDHHLSTAWSERGILVAEYEVRSTVDAMRAAGLVVEML